MRDARIHSVCVCQNDSSVHQTATRTKRVPEMITVHRHTAVHGFLPANLHKLARIPYKKAELKEMCSADTALPMASSFGSTQITERGATSQILPRKDKTAGDHWGVLQKGTYMVRAHLGGLTCLRQFNCTTQTKQLSVMSKRVASLIST